jgi:hypothetical protein
MSAAVAAEEKTAKFAFETTDVLPVDPKARHPISAFPILRDKIRRNSAKDQMRVHRPSRGGRQMSYSVPGMIARSVVRLFRLLRSPSATIGPAYD